MIRTIASFSLAVVVLLGAALVFKGLEPADVTGGLSEPGGHGLFPVAFHRAEVAPVHGPNILLVVVDTLRADHMSLYGYARKTTPRLDTFATGCRVFSRAYASAPFTIPSVLSMLTGLYPYNHGVRMFWQRLTARNITVVDHLRRAGYEAGAVISNIVLSDRACGLGARFDHYDDRVDEPEPRRPHMLQRRASRTTDAAIAWLKDRPAPERPFFLWVHYIDPHGPYTPPEGSPVNFEHDHPRPVDPEELLDYVREPGVTDGLEYVDRYDEEIAYTDREVGRLLQAFADLGLADDALIIFTADHGEYMMDGDHFHFCHGYNVEEAVIRIPLIIRYKTLVPGRMSHPVSIADIMPTVLSVAGLPVPEGLDGRSLLGEISARPPYAEGPESKTKGRLRRTFVYPRRKIVVQHGRSNIARRAWAYDLFSDPEELHPLPVDASEPAYIVLADLIRADPDPAGIPSNYAKGGPPSARVANGADEEALKVLKSLGYLE